MNNCHMSNTVKKIKREKSKSSRASAVRTHTHKHAYINTYTHLHTCIHTKGGQVRACSCPPIASVCARARVCLYVRVYVCMRAHVRATLYLTY